jgi:hypothetical protein
MPQADLLAQGNDTQADDADDQSAGDGPCDAPCGSARQPGDNDQACQSNGVKHVKLLRGHGFSSRRIINCSSNSCAELSTHGARQVQSSQTTKNKPEVKGRAASA